MRTANPALNKKTFSNMETTYGGTEAMTIQGVVNKTMVLLLLLLVTSSQIWRSFMKSGSTQVIMPWMLLGLIGGFIVALITVFNKKSAGITAPIYALLEGLAIGGISSLVESQYPGLVIQAVALTFGTLFSLLFLYKSGMIKVTENFKLGVVAATGGIMLIYLATFIMGLFGVNMPYIHGSGTIGIVFSLFVVTVAAMNLVLDFDFIESGSDAGAPKYMEWYAAFGLMVTLIWLYIEILRLLVKLQRRR